MTLTYIFHSGFALETRQSILIFDYWHDPSDCLPAVLKKAKPVYVFSSHFHEDHFNREIFEWEEQREDITYILSKDILRHRRAVKENADVWLGKGGSWNDENISVCLFLCTLWQAVLNHPGVSVNSRKRLMCLFGK